MKRSAKEMENAELVEEVEKHRRELRITVDSTIG